MPSSLHVTLELPAADGLPKDNPVWNFAFIGPTPVTGTTLTAIQAAIEAFYTANHGTLSHSIGNFLSTAVSRTVPPIMRTYDKTGFENGAASGGPIDIRNTALIPTRTGGTVDLPSEVAVTLSFHSDYGTLPEFGPGHTRIRARHRGRIYIGPLTTLALVSNADKGPSVSGAALDTFSGAAIALMGDTGTTWAQWSRVDHTFREVTGGWVDDAPDTQRRRGEDATLRNVWP